MIDANKKEKLSQIINDGRKDIFIPNASVAENKMSMDRFDDQMRGTQGRMQLSSVATLMAIFGLVFMWSKSQSEKDYNFFIITLTTFIAWKGYEISTNRFLFLSEPANKSIVLHRDLRPQLRSAKTSELSETLAKQANLIRKSKVGQCDELCIILGDKLLNSSEFNGMYLTKLGLKDPKNSEHTHSVIVLSSGKLSLSAGKLWSIKNATVVDPWYNNVISTSQAQNFSDYPLLNYDIFITDFSMQITDTNTQRSHPSVVRFEPNSSTHVKPNL